MDNKNYCFSHDPDSVEKKLLASSKGGLARVIKVDVPLEVITIATPGDVVNLLASTINEVREGKIDPRVANTIGFLAGHLIRALEIAEVNRKIEEVHAVLLKREKLRKD